MTAIELTAVFDEEGKMVVEKLPSIRNKKVRMLLLIEEDDNDFYTLSQKGLVKAYGEDEPDYDLQLVKEPNTDYKK